MRKTRRAVIVDEGWRSGSLAAEISARIMEQAFYDLDAPVARVCSAEVPIPYAKHLEEAALPQVPKIVAAARGLFGGGSVIRFELPSLGADMDAGTLLEWKVKPGDAVTRGHVVAVVDTSKAAVDVEIWHAGVVAELLVQPGEKVPVGTVLATLTEPGEAAAAVTAPAAGTAPAPAAAASAAAAPAGVQAPAAAPADVTVPAPACRSCPRSQPRSQPRRQRPLRRVRSRPRRPFRRR